MEILAPVNTSTLDAALEAGADAVYFGLKRLNARRGAKNFSQEELADAVKRIHAAGAKAHLTVNINLTTRETGLAARTLQLAANAGVDAVIVRDPAILSLRKYFPTLEFHLSTQAGLSSSAGVRFAASCGCQRAVLAREMTADEIKAACGVDGIDIEVFIQGALCFCASGHCLLSSWVGGRSGNRGACASPCRVAWRTSRPDSLEAHPLSMHDLCMISHLRELADAGVASLKIEGRLKAPGWVRRAVSLYRHASAGNADLETIRKEADELGEYTGRELTAGYYEGVFTSLTDADAGRQRQATHNQPEPAANERPLHLEITIAGDEGNGTSFELQYGDAASLFRIPWQRIASPRRATPLGELLVEAMRAIPRSFAPQINLPEDLRTRLLPRRCGAVIRESLEEFLRNVSREDDGTIRTPIPVEVSTALTLTGEVPCPQNRRRLGDVPNRLRLAAAQLAALLHREDSIPRTINAVIVEIWCDADMELLLRHGEKLSCNGRREIIVALPPVVYEEQLESVAGWCRTAAARNWCVEVNSWDTLQLARENNVTFETAGCLAVTNPPAARWLADLGSRCCTISPEMDCRQMEELTAAADVPLALTTNGRPPLMITRAKLPEEFAPAKNGKPGSPFADGRGTNIFAEAAGALTLLRPVTPYDLRRSPNQNIRLANMTIDLCGAQNPLAEMTPPAKGADTFKFNYDRDLK